MTAQTPIARVLLPELLEHQGGLATLLHQYIKQAALDTSAQAGLHRGLQDQALQLHQHQMQLGELIVVLGGLPLGSMLELVNVSPLEPEAEHTTSWVAMLSNTLHLEMQHDDLLEMTRDTAVALSLPRIAQILYTIRTSGRVRRTWLLKNIDALENRP